MAVMISLIGKEFNSWTVQSYAGNYKWNCICICGETKVVSGYDLTRNKSKSCAKCSNKLKQKPQNDLTDMHFGELTCIEYVGDSKWKCKCSCGKETEVSAASLVNGTTKSCGHIVTLPKIDLSNETFGDWKVLYYTAKGMWMCQCSCGKTQLINEYGLKNGKTTSCGHSMTKVDITNQIFGELKAIKNMGNRKWLCKCSCGNEIKVDKHKLLNGSTKSCGCMVIKKRKDTCIEKYGVDVFNPRCSDRTQSQINYTRSKELMQNLMQKMTVNDIKPSVFELENALNIRSSAVLKYIHQYSLEEFASIGIFNTSRYEQEIYDMFPYAVRNDRKTLNGLEIDLLYTEHKLAVEFNGDYWHNSDMISKEYHQQKTIDCAKQGIQLIHIFEYEWNNSDTRNKLIQILKSKLDKENSIIYARKCCVKQIEWKQAKQFLDTYHLQQSIASEVYIGIEYNKDLLGVMTFGKPRFDSNFEWELVRLAFKQNIIILGGIERLFGLFIKTFNPSSIISYCNIAKFTGNSYLKLGFKAVRITNPSYVWVKGDKVLSRYQTQKHKLIKQRLGTNEQTEDEIMKSLGFLKIHDCGNLVLEWRKEVN